MGYLGLTPTTAQQNYLNIDDISGSFNGTTTSFALQVGGVAPTPFPVTNSCLISVGGVVQQPDDTGTDGFRISGGNIIFSSAPGTGEDFFGLVLAGADYLNVGANFPDGTVGTPSITFESDLNTGIYHPSADSIAITNGGTAALTIDSNRRVGIGTTSPVRDLHVHGTNTDSEIVLTNSTTGDTAGNGFMLQQDGNDTYIWNKENSFMSFGTNALERLRIADTGAFGLSGANYGTSGQALLSQGSGSAPQWGDVAPDGAFRSVQYFTTSGTHTWTRPAGLQRVRVYVTGGGGGGALENTNTASGGGAGGTAIELIEVASLGATETVTVGASGADRSGSYGPGSSGGTSSFGSHCSATGGGGGTSSYTGQGGIGSNGDFNIRGGAGHYSWGSARSGNGGNSFWAGGGQGAGPNQGGSNGTFGSGGGGSTGSGGGAALISGAGGAGIVVVEQYF